MADYQILIVGAGLAGLHCALRLSERFPNMTIAIAEAYNYVGGRVVSYHPKQFPDVHWENGAGRIHSSHTLVKAYLKHYHLKELPIPSTQIYKGSGYQGKNTWDSFSEIITKSLQGLSSTILSSHTVEELLEKSYGKEKTKELLHHFPYCSEVKTLRADLALKSFQTEMGTTSHFTVVEKGLSSLTSAIRKELDDRGVTFLMRHRLSALEPGTSPIACKFVKQEEDGKKSHLRIHADKVILALHSEALKGISPFANLPVLKKLSMKPLLRTYGIFPKNPRTSWNRPHTVWFEGLPHTVTDSPLRYIIPIDSEKGTIMTSYTDAQDTQPWVRIFKQEGEAGLGSAIVNHLRKEFPDRSIPNPVYFKAHLWHDGCTYWLPGSYSPQEESEKVMCPLPMKWQNVYVCGESFSLRQAWMEGALEHAEAMLNKYFL